MESFNGFFLIWGISAAHASPCICMCIECNSVFEVFRNSLISRDPNHSCEMAVQIQLRWIHLWSGVAV